MTEDLFKKCENLKLALNNSKEVIELNEIENLLKSDKEICLLAAQKEQAILNYEDAIKHFGEQAEETKSAQRKLYEIKLNLDNQPLVVLYNEKYKKVCEIYDNINDEIFSKILK